MDLLGRVYKSYGSSRQSSAGLYFSTSGLGSFRSSSVPDEHILYHIAPPEPSSPRATKVKLNVDMSCGGCAASVRKAFEGVEGIESIEIDVPTKEVHIVSALPAEKLLKIARTTGRTSSIHGISSTEGVDLGTAVSVLEKGDIQGVVRFVQLTEDVCVVQVTIKGVSPGPHAIHVHTYGDLSDGDKTVGPHWNPYEKEHGGLYDENRHAGDLGNIEVQPSGEGELSVEAKGLKVWDIIGRSVVVKEGEDDLGKGENATSKVTGNAGKGVVYGVIARSAGFGENRKKICTCDSPNF